MWKNKFPSDHFADDIMLDFFENLEANEPDRRCTNQIFGNSQALDLKIKNKPDKLHSQTPYFRPKKEH